MKNLIFDKPVTFKISVETFQQNFLQVNNFMDGIKNALADF